MLTELNIRNFRLYKNLQLKPLKRVNIVTGNNGTGKSSILEALFLIAGATNVSLVLALWNFRGETHVSPSVDTPFRSLFHDLDPENVIELSARGGFTGNSGTRKDRKLSITPIVTPVISAAQTESAVRISGVNLNFVGPRSKGSGKFYWPDSASPRDAEQKPASPTNAVIERDPVDDLIMGYYFSPYHVETWVQVGQLLTEATKEKRLDEIVSRMKIMDERIQSIVSLSEQGRPTIYVDIGGKKLFPSSIMGAGFSHALSIILQAIVLKNGVLLIDEIEDGLHFSKMPNLLRFLLEISEINNLQIFIATHSEEVIRIFVEVCEKQEFTDLSLFHLTRKQDVISVKSFNYDALRAAQEIQAEVR